jgi:small-conductance mechanosensitive channel
VEDGVYEGILAEKIYGNFIVNWALALLITFVVYLAIRIGVRVIGKRLKGLASRTRTSLDDHIVSMVSGTRRWFALAIGLYAGARVLVLDDKADAFLAHVAMIALLVQVALWANYAVGAWLQTYGRATAGTDVTTAATYSVLGFVARLAVWSVLALMVLANLNFDITALVASLGIGGIAVALAVQNILGDLFASLSIALDKPFMIGDFIVVGDFMGNVEHVGLKSTRLRSISGEQIVVANTDLLGSRVRNYKRMQERRIAFSLGLVYQTPADKLERVPAMLREIIEAQPNARFDRAHFKEYGDSALIFEIVYYVRQPDYAAFMDTQQAINLTIFRRFEADGLDFAYPTQTLIVQRDQGPSEAAPTKQSLSRAEQPIHSVEV